MFTLTADVMGDTQVARGFSRFGDGIQDLRPAFKLIARDFHEGEERQFTTGGHYGAGGWEPLQPSTLDRKSRAGYPADILVRSGDLRESLSGRGSQAIETIRKTSAIFGTKLRYSGYHQSGTRRMPARPLIMLAEEQKTRWHKIIHEHIFQASQEAF